MSQTAGTDFVKSAYDLAWEEMTRIPGLSSHEVANSALQLRLYVNVMVEVGERDPQAIARSAVGMTRQYQQIARSRSRIDINRAV